MLVRSTYTAGGSQLRLSAPMENTNPSFNPLKAVMVTLKPQSNAPLYSNTVIGTLAIDGWTVTFATARSG